MDRPKITIVFPSPPPIWIKEELLFDFRQKDSWEFGTGLGLLADITTVRDSLRARRDLGVTGSVGLARFTCPLARPVWRQSNGEKGRNNRRKNICTISTHYTLTRLFFPSLFYRWPCQKYFYYLFSLFLLSTNLTPGARPTLIGQW
jgi:hypothetical protein